MAISMGFRHDWRRDTTSALNSVVGREKEASRVLQTENCSNGRP